MVGGETGETFGRKRLNYALRGLGIGEKGNCWSNIFFIVACQIKKMYFCNDK